MSKRTMHEWTLELVLNELASEAVKLKPELKLERRKT